MRLAQPRFQIYSAREAKRWQQRATNLKEPRAISHLKNSLHTIQHVVGIKSVYEREI